MINHKCRGAIYPIIMKVCVKQRLDTGYKIGLIREMDRSQPKALPRQQASGPPVAHRLAATPALGEGDADAAGNGL